MKERIVKLAKAIWSHRAAYAGLALAYGCGCAGLIDKEVVAQIVTALYAAMFTQRH
ncbi:MAG: hypothetical protein AAGG09_09155 [Pseudomonadota bacterium]